MPAALVSAFPASNYRLLDVARRAVNDSMLRMIAEADYGTGADECLAELRSIRDTGVLPLTLRSWEVLTLSAFSPPDGLDREPGGSGERADRTAAFAGAVVLRGQFEGCGGGSPETALARCLASARLLGEEMNRAIGGFLTWAIPLTGDADCGLFKLGLLVIAARVLSDQSTEPILGEAAAWVLAEEAGSRPSAFERPPAPVGWQQGFWRPLGAELIDRAARIQTKTVYDDLLLLGQFVLEAG
ncbi:MAG TPA: hypothetical protein VG826_16180 [Pirellulales bacterium]|nr:hypothetical protein [Pirellulales bacterium]